MSERPPIPSRDAFFDRLIHLHSWMSVPALVIVLSCVHVFLQLTPDQWKVLGISASIYGVIAFPVTRMIQRRMMHSVLAWLDGMGPPEPAFAVTLDRGLRAGLLGAISWVIPTTLVSMVMDVWFVT